MKRAIAKLCCLVGAVAIAAAQTHPATRPVRLSWTASTSSGVTGYNIYRCAVTAPATTLRPYGTGDRQHGGSDGGSRLSAGAGNLRLRGYGGERGG